MHPGLSFRPKQRGAWDRPPFQGGIKGGFSLSQALEITVSLRNSYGGLSRRRGGVLSSFVACLCEKVSGRRKRRFSDVSYREILLPLSTAQRSHKFKGRVTVYIRSPYSSLKEQRARHLRMTEISITPAPMPLAPSVKMPDDVHKF